MNRRARNSTEVLKAAKWLLENVGWIKGQSCKVDFNTGQYTGFCASGAIGMVHAVDKPDVFTIASQRLADALPKRADGSIVGFNDDPTTTKKDVLDLFNRAIKGKRRRNTKSSKRR